MMDALLDLEAELVSWLNQGVGKFFLLDRATYLVVSDYFVPLLMCFWMLGLWFHGKDAGARDRNQRAVLSAAISLGLANLAVLALNQHYFRERPTPNWSWPICSMRPLTLPSPQIQRPSLLPSQ